MPIETKTLYSHREFLTEETDDADANSITARVTTTIYSSKDETTRHLSSVVALRGYDGTVYFDGSLENEEEKVKYLAALGKMRDVLNNVIAAIEVFTLPPSQEKENNE